MSVLDDVQTLRFKTSAGMMECKEALKEAGGNIEKAIDILRKKGIAKAAKKASRVAGQGIIESYIHGGRIGVMLELGCETDFVARNAEFKSVARELAMQVAAAHPLYVAPENVPAEAIEREKGVISAQSAGKPANVVEKIVAGRIDKYLSEVCLLEQPYIKDPAMKVKDIVTQLISKIGENIVVKRFTRYEVGEEF